MPKPYTDRQRITDYRMTFNSEAGRRVLADLCKRHGVFALATNFEPHQVLYWKGQADVILEILGYMDMKPEDVEVRETLSEVTT